MNEANIAMQTRCPSCDKEQHALNVLAFSNGEVPCQHCGKLSRQMTYDQWYGALNLLRRTKEKS